MANEHGSADDSYSESGSEDLVDRILVLYASETGNAQDAAERTGREIRRRGGCCTVMSMEDFDVAELPHTRLLIVLTSTHGRGQPPPAMLPLWNLLLRSGLPDDILEEVHFALYGLGDSSYEKFCYAGKILARRLLSLGAQLVGPSSDLSDAAESLKDLQVAVPTQQTSDTKAAIGQVPDTDDVGPSETTSEAACLAWGDERAPDGYEETFLPWLEQTMRAMLPFLPFSPLALDPLPSTALPPPLYKLTPASGSSDPKAGPSSEVGQSRYLDRGWIRATLAKNERITPEDWWQDVRDVELELEDEESWNYAPGSICSLKPEISSEEVSTFLRYTDLEDQADDPVIIEPLDPYQPIPRHLPANRVTTLRQLLTCHLDLRCTPRKSFFEWLRRLTVEERETERLDDFLSDPDEIHTYATRPRRTILETLADFRAIKLPLSHILEILPPLRRRQFSIASAAKIHAGKVQLLVALVDYKTNLAIRRRGLLSSWLKALEPGHSLSVLIDQPTLFLPSDPETPVVLVGPGTGVAPMRAFVEERIRTGAAAVTALYFGCRSRSKDMFYESEMARWREAGVHVRVACSRDQEEKIYVQQLIKQDHELLQDWIGGRNGNVYISGSSNAMPKAVREAIAYCLSTESPSGKLSRPEADHYVEQMFESGKRGGEESW